MMKRDPPISFEHAVIRALRKRGFIKDADKPSLKRAARQVHELLRVHPRLEKYSHQVLTSQRGL
jgi:hypothetical protein